MHTQPLPIATCVHLFCGIGGGALGFQAAGFHTLAAVDIDPDVCADFQRLTGAPAHARNIESMEPADLNALTGGTCPDVVFTSPPCTGFSACLPKHMAIKPKYQDLNALTVRGIFLSVMAWDEVPKLIVMENVPRIQSRGQKWLRHIVLMLEAFGYRVQMTTHDAGEIGALAQHRRRFLLVARRADKVPEFLYEPPVYDVRACGEELSTLPVPKPDELTAGPMHRLPRMSMLNWVRLALIRPGKDWRDLPESVGLSFRKGRINGGYGVNDWNQSAHTVVSEGSVHNAWNSVSDPRVTCERRDGSMGVTNWNDPSTTIIGNGTHHNGPWQVSDPRLAHSPRRGAFYVQSENEPAGTVIGASTALKGNAYADGRTVEPTHVLLDSDAMPVLVGPEIDLDSKKPGHLVIVARDGTWHRPMTTLELAVLQGFPARFQDEWLTLGGRSHKTWRKRIGNAVPPASAKAIALEMLATLGGAPSVAPSSGKTRVWVHPFESHLLPA